MLDPGNYDGTYTADSGALCLDFVNTLSRRSTDQPHEWLNSFDDLIELAEIAGALTNNEARAMRQSGTITQEAGVSLLQRAHGLREAVYQVFMAGADSTSPPEEATDILNTELRVANGKRSLQWNGEGFMWQITPGAAEPDKILWAVALSAAELLNSPNLQRVGECQSPDCGWLFLDTSKNHSRRWCSMEDCGNREKARKHYRRKQGLAANE
jgi:predicted RNA-binding Zn ribbon-like protein